VHAWEKVGLSKNTPRSGRAATRYFALFAGGAWIPDAKVVFLGVAGEVGIRIGGVS
jgi:hypothetical protein